MSSLNILAHALPLKELGASLLDFDHMMFCTLHHKFYIDRLFSSFHTHQTSFSYIFDNITKFSFMDMRKAKNVHKLNLMMLKCPHFYTICVKANKFVLQQISWLWLCFVDEQNYGFIRPHTVVFLLFLANVHIFCQNCPQTGFAGFCLFSSLFVSSVISKSVLLHFCESFLLKISAIVLFQTLAIIWCFKLAALNYKCMILTNLYTKNIYNF